MRTIPLFLCLFLLGPGLFAQSVEQNLDTYLNQQLTQAAAPGFSVAIVKGDQLIYCKGFGQESIDRPQPMSEQSVLAIGSLTKSFTALGLMQLAEQGRLDLDRPVKDYLPWFHTANPERSDKITTRMLLNNSSGLAGGQSDFHPQADSAAFLMLKGLEGQYISTEPGVAYAYSNTGFALAGYLLHHLSGQPYAQYLQEQIFQPLDMRQSSTVPGDFERIGSIYGHYPGITQAIPAQRETANESGAMAAAGSLLRSSARDLGAYMIALLNDGKYKGHQLLSPGSITEMWRAQSCFPGLSYAEGGENEELGYGLGWMTGEIEGHRIVFHGGSTGTTSSLMMLDPEHRLGAVILLNFDYTFLDQYRYPTEINIVNNLLHIAKGEEPTNYGIPLRADPTLNAYELDPGAYPNYLGHYRFAEGWDDSFVYYGLDLTIREENGKLLADANRGERLISRFELDFVNPQLAVRRFQAAADPVRFQLAADGSVKSISVFGTRFVRHDETQEDQFRLMNSRWGNFLLPRAYQADTLDQLFSAHTATGNSIWIGLESEIISPEQHLSRLLDGVDLSYVGKARQQKKGIFLWEQHAFLVDEQAYLFMQTRWQGRQWWIVYTCTEGSITTQAARELQALIQSLVLH